MDEKRIFFTRRKVLIALASGAAGVGIIGSKSFFFRSDPHEKVKNYPLRQFSFLPLLSDAWLENSWVITVQPSLSYWDHLAYKEMRFSGISILTIYDLSGKVIYEKAWESSSKELSTKISSDLVPNAASAEFRIATEEISPFLPQPEVGCFVTLKAKNGAVDGHHGLRTHQSNKSYQIIPQFNGETDSFILSLFNGGSDECAFNLELFHNGKVFFSDHLTLAPKASTRIGSENVDQNLFSFLWNKNWPRGHVLVQTTSTRGETAVSMDLSFSRNKNFILSHGVNYRNKYLNRITPHENIYSMENLLSGKQATEYFPVSWTTFDFVPSTLEGQELQHELYIPNIISKVCRVRLYGLTSEGRIVFIDQFLLNPHEVRKVNLSRIDIKSLIIDHGLSHQINSLVKLYSSSANNSLFFCQHGKADERPVLAKEPREEKFGETDYWISGVESRDLEWVDLILTNYYSRTITGIEVQLMRGSKSFKPLERFDLQGYSQKRVRLFEQDGGRDFSSVRATSPSNTFKTSLFCKTRSGQYFVMHGTNRLLLKNKIA
jgi:hypothetical protein